MSGVKEKEMEEKEPMDDELNLPKEEFFDQDIIESFYNVNAEMMFLKKAMKKQMTDRDKKNELYEEWKKDNSSLMQTVETLIEEFMHQESMMEEANKMQQRVAAEHNSKKRMPS